MEVLLVFWLIFIIKYPAYRPKKSWITWGILAYFGAILISCFFSVDVNLSVWGNAERMLGLFHLLHFLIFYIILITVMRSKQDWQNFFDAFLVVMGIIVIYSFVKHYEASTIGNTAYVAGLMIFGFAFALWRLVESRDWLKRSIYILAMLLTFVGFWRSDISGAQAGFMAGLLAFGLVYALVNKNKKVRVIAISAVAGLIVIVAMLFIFRNSPLMKDGFISKRLSDFTTSNNTLNTRLISWKSAYLDFHNHPVFGTGYGTYAYTFDKFLTPEFFDYSPNESYFDRAHNNIVDIASTTGILGLLAYLSIFVAAGYYLILLQREKKVSAFQFSWLVALIVAYFVQNLAVFDSLVTYVSIFSPLGFIYYLYNYQDEVMTKEKNIPAISEGREVLWFFVFGLTMLLIIQQLNVRGFKMLKGDIMSYRTISGGKVQEGFEMYKANLAEETGYNRDSRSTLVNIVVSNPAPIAKLPMGVALDIVGYAAGLSKENLAYDPTDSMMSDYAAKALNLAARFNYQDEKISREYANEALAIIDRAIQFSPGRFMLLYTRSDINMTMENKEQAIKDLERAISIKPNWGPSYCNLAQSYYFLENYDKAYESLAPCVKFGGIGSVNDKNLLAQAASYYTKKGDTVLAQTLSERAATLK
jgi:O-antigen ligase